MSGQRRDGVAFLTRRVMILVHDHRRRSPIDLLGRLDHRTSLKRTVQRAGAHAHAFPRGKLDSATSSPICECFADPPPANRIGFQGAYPTPVSGHGGIRDKSTKS